jgi:hypothetical protein
MRGIYPAANVDINDSSFIFISLPFLTPEALILDAAGWGIRVVRCDFTPILLGVLLGVRGEQHHLVVAMDRKRNIWKGAWNVYSSMILMSCSGRSCSCLSI